MARPDFAFRTSTHTFYAQGRSGEFRAEPGGARLWLEPQQQRVPPELLSPELERSIMAWVISRGGRTLRLNGAERAIGPQALDRPALRPVRRLVSIAPSNTEIVGALDAGGLLVGVENSSDIPAEVRTLPRLGPDLFVNLDALAALQPDLVLASLTVPGMERNIAGLERLGLPYLVLAPQNVAEIREDVLRVGRALHLELRAAQVVEKMDAGLAALPPRLADSSAVPVYLEWWPKPMVAPGACCWTNEMLQLAGGRNVFQHRPGQSTQIEVEDLVRADPEVILVAWCGVPLAKLNVDRVLRRAGLEGVRAVRQRRVYAVDESLLGRPGPRVVEGIARMARAIAPPG